VSGGRTTRTTRLWRHTRFLLLEAISDPEHEQHEELLDWLGDDFDPQAFSVDEVNRRLALLQRRRKKAAAGKH
jgi:hypothetical protein